MPCATNSPTPKPMLCINPPRLQRLKSFILLLAALVSLGGCSFGLLDSSTSDSAPSRRLDPNRIPDAVPRAEPRSRGGNSPSYVVNGRRYYTMKSSRGYRERGIASWYGTKFHGRKTANGERYDMYAMTAAHKELPIPSYVRVTNLRNGRSAVVRVNDRGPFHNNRIIDLSYAAATKLGILGEGTGLVEVVALQPGGPAPAPARTYASRPDGNPNMFVQVGAFANRENADRLRWRLQNSLKRSVRIQRTGEHGTVMYRVQVGPVFTVEQADSLTFRLAELGIREYQTVID